MAHEAHDESPLHMGLPISNGKLAMWLFLVTEIMFFTGLIGTYIVLRGGARSWPTPSDVHLLEWVGALNTFVLIVSSLTVVLAHWHMGKGNVKASVIFVVVTLLLGGVFLVVKAFEYKAKFDHHVLPGFVFERLDAPDGPDSLNELSRQLSAAAKEIEERQPTGKDAEALKKIKHILADMELTANRAPLAIDQLKEELHELHKEYPDVHVTPVIPMGNMWASCYFAMTGFHALHVTGGLVVFIIMLIMAALGRFGIQHTSLLELTGLYWHFVDIVWIFLFPLLYLI